MTFSLRFRSALRASGIHLLLSVAIALVAAYVVLGLWYPYPYREISGGRDLFLLMVLVDVICGPLLTLVLFNPSKPKREMRLDLGLVATLQLAALGFGVWTSWQARPLFLALELDRFKVVMAADVDNLALNNLSPELRPSLFGGVRTVALRRPVDTKEKNRVLFESVQGGRDYAERPEFYIPYAGSASLASLDRAKDLASFLKKYPDQRFEAERIAKEQEKVVSEWRYLPVVGRQDWIALLDSTGTIQGFLKGDGF